MIWSAKWVLVAALTFALCAYGLDCIGTTIPEQSMGCCKTMRCHSPRGHHSHSSMGCCDTTPQTHAPLGQASLVQSVAFFGVAFGLVQSFSGSQTLAPVPGVFAGSHSHDPPVPSVTAALTIRV